MEQATNGELKNQLEWSKLRVSQLEAEVESWRNKALVAQMKVKDLEDENRKLRQKFAHSLPLYDPDDFIAKG